MYKLKFKPDGSIQRFKARFIAKGFHQQPGIDFSKTFSPVVIKQPTIRVVLTLAIHFGWDIQQLDVENAFLNGFLHETVYMTQLGGIVDAQHLDYVYKLNKAL